MLITTEFLNAVIDFQYLLEKEYSMKNMLKIVGDRYKLSNIQRSFLYRGITTDSKAKNRKQKLITEKNINEGIIHIDSYNVLLTIHNYLKGKPTFMAYDGFVRDAGELKGKISQLASFNRPIDLVCRYIKTFEYEKVLFHIDKPVKESTELQKQIQKAIKQQIINANTKIEEKVDNELIKLKKGILATSDSEIIDQTNLNVFDLAKNTLIYHFNVNFMNLQNVTNPKQR